MPDFVNTIDVKGDDSVFAKILDRTIEEYADDVITQLRAHAFYYCSKLHTVNLPNVTKIGDYCFQQCSSLINVKLDAAVCSTGPYGCFEDCSSIEKISLPLWEHLNNSMFTDCSKLKRCYAPKAATIGTYVFQRCNSLLTLCFPSAARFETYPFAYCTNLCALILPKTGSVPYLGGSLCLGKVLFGSTGYIFVPETLMDSYKSATNWSTYASRFKAIENYNALDKYDEDYVNAGYTVVHPKTVFTTGSESGGFSLSSSITFESGKTYKVLYDHNEYDIVATSEGLVRTADDGTGFTIAQPVSAANNVVSTRAELFSSVIGIYTM